MFAFGNADGGATGRIYRSRDVNRSALNIEGLGIKKKVENIFAGGKSTILIYLMATYLHLTIGENTFI